MNLELREEQFFQSLLATTERYLHQLGISPLTPVTEKQERCLGAITSLIEVRGAIRGGFMLSVDLQLARTFAMKYMIDEISEEEAAQYADDVVAEISNVITGNALTDWDEHDIFLGYPHMIAAGRKNVPCGPAAFYQPFLTAFGKLDCIYVPGGSEECSGQPAV